MRNDSILLIINITVLVLVSDTGGILFKKGSYKSHKKGNKINVNDVASIDNVKFIDTGYLKVRANIPILQAGSVHNLTNLKTLKLDSCEIEIVNPGAFTNLPNLRVICLNDNEIKGIKSGVFNSLNVTALYLHRNNISFIETQAFDNITSLEKIKLNSNRISYWDDNWFRNTPNLVDVFVRRNYIRSLPVGAFKNLEFVQNGEKQRKINIYLSRNIISSISSRAFSGLTKCGQIWLDRNEIRNLHQDLFERMDNMEVLFLSSNVLTTLPNDIFDNLKSDLITLDLAHNNNLTCLDYDVVAKVKMTNLERIRNLNCSCVKTLQDKFVSDGKNYEVKSDCKT